MSKKEIIKRLHDIGVIYEEPVTLRSGVNSGFYCDIKKAFGYPDLLNALADEIGKQLHESVTCIAGSGYGGLPIATLVASRFGKKFIAVRDTPKKHGKGGLIDGYIPNEKDVMVIVDDVLTTGGSIKATLATLAMTKGKIKNAIVLVKRGEAELTIPYLYIFTIDEILENKPA